MIDELDRIMSIRAGKEEAHWSNHIGLPPGNSASNNRPVKEYGQKTFLALMIEYGLSIYIREKLGRQPRQL